MADLSQYAVKISRKHTGDQGTDGVLVVSGNPFTCVTGELPWRDNAPDLSRIPVGTYRCSQLFSPHFGQPVYHVLGVPGRGDVEIHWGNWFGDTTLGFRSDVLGCILLGAEVTQMAPPGMAVQLAISGSKPTVLEFMNILQGLDFILTVEDDFAEAA